MLALLPFIKQEKGEGSKKKYDLSRIREKIGLQWQETTNVIRQKGESQNGCFKKDTPNFPKNEHFLRTCAYQGVRDVGFSENLACFVFFKHSFWDSPFCFITDKKWQRCSQVSCKTRRCKDLFLAVNYCCKVLYFRCLHGSLLHP